MSMYLFVSASSNCQIVIYEARQCHEFSGYTQHSGIANIYSCRIDFAVVQSQWPSGCAFYLFIVEVTIISPRSISHHLHNQRK